MSQSFHKKSKELKPSKEHKHSTKEGKSSSKENAGVAVSGPDPHASHRKSASFSSIALLLTRLTSALHSYGPQAIADDLFVDEQDKIHRLSTERLSVLSTEALKAYRNTCTDRYNFLTGVAATTLRERAEVKRKLLDLPAIEGRSKRQKVFVYFSSIFIVMLILTKPGPIRCFNCDQAGHKFYQCLQPVTYVLKQVPSPENQQNPEVSDASGDIVKSMASCSLVTPDSGPDST